MLLLIFVAYIDYMRIKNNLIKEWNSIPNSVKFWNGLLLLILIGFGIYNIELLFAVLLFASLLAFFVLLDVDDFSIHIWVWFTPFAWSILIIGSIIVLVRFISTKTILPFNDWLNKKRDEK